MAKKKTTTKKKTTNNQVNRTPPVSPVPQMTARQAVQTFFSNASLLSRASLQTAFTSLDDGSKDINVSCGYPNVLDIGKYRGMFDREGLATKVVKFYPEECWATDPRIYQDEAADETEFEKAWADLNKSKQILHYLLRVDILSGIGEFGVLLLGLADGQELNEPVEGINETTGEKTGNSTHELLYLKPFAQDVVTIKKKEEDPKSPRYGKPVQYEIKFQDVRGGATTSKTKIVHWTRLLHVADNRLSSDVLGVPRMQSLYNRLLDIRKVISGSAEMFWKGAFPGYIFEVMPEMNDAEIDADALKEELTSWSAGLERYLKLTGMTAKSMDPQVANPEKHINSHMRYIALAMDVPYRIFIGTEEAKLASTQDMKAWNKRLAKRQNTYLTSQVISPLIDHLMLLGILPEVEEYFVEWPDLNTPSDKDKAEVASLQVDALAKYMQGDVDQIVPPKEFFMMFLGKTEDEAEELVKAAKIYIGELDTRRTEEVDDDDDNNNDIEGRR